MKDEKKKILIIDDEPGLLFSMVAFLEDEGFTAVGTSSGEEALQHLVTDQYDAVVVDVRLPGIDGNEVILQALAKGCGAKFLIHTGSTDYILPKTLINHGFSQEDIFLKPLPDLDIICQALHKRFKKD